MTETERVLHKEIALYWESGQYVVNIRLPYLYPPVYDLPWVPYESYMRAQVVKAMAGKTGHLIINFPPETSEDNRLHIHPISDRIVTVIKGGGEFVAERDGKIVHHELYFGDCVWMPRAVLHTFFAGTNGLLVEAFHNPWIPFEDPQCIVYPADAPIGGEL